MAFYRVEPFGDDWKQAAMIGSICSTAATNLKYSRTIPESELIPRFVSETPPEATEEQFNATVNNLAESMNLMGGF